MSTTKRRRGPAADKTPGDLMQQPSAGKKHPAPLGVKEMMDQGTSRRFTGEGQRSVKSLQRQ